MTHSRRRGTRLVGVALAMALVVAGAWWVLWRSDMVLVEEVVISGSDERWESEVRAAAAIALSQPMVEVDTESAVSEIGELTFVKDVDVRRSWPSTITIEVTLREPVLAVQTGAGQFSLVDDTGVTIETSAVAPEGVPLLTARGSAGSTEEAHRAAWQVIATLPDGLLAEVTGATISSADLVTLRLGERTVVWGGPENAELKLQVMEALLAAGESYIDVSAPRTPVTRPSESP